MTMTTTTQKLDPRVAKAALARRLPYAEIARLLRHRRPLPPVRFDSSQRPIELPNAEEQLHYVEQRCQRLRYIRQRGSVPPARCGVDSPGAAECCHAGRVAAALGVEYAAALRLIRSL
jgi:hypothetical protein